jgi:hypothetical protein
MLFQQAENILADHFGGDFRFFAQAITDPGGQFESIFKLETGIEQTAGQNSTQKRNASVFFLIDNNSFQAESFDMGQGIICALY